MSGTGSIITSKNKVLLLERLFYDFPVSSSEFYKAKVNPSFIGKFMKYLEKEKLAKVEQRGNMRLWSPDFANQQAIHLFLMLENARVEKLLGRAPRIAPFIRQLSEGASGETIILFGSHAKGEETRDSDLDILVVEERRQDSTEKRIRSVLSAIKSEVRFVTFNELVAKGRSNPLLRSILRRPRERMILANGEKFLKIVAKLIDENL